MVLNVSFFERHFNCALFRGSSLWEKVPGYPGSPAFPFCPEPPGDPGRPGAPGSPLMPEHGEG